MIVAVVVSKVGMRCSDRWHVWFESTGTDKQTGVAKQSGQKNEPLESSNENDLRELRELREEVSTLRKEVVVRD